MRIVTVILSALLSVGIALAYDVPGKCIERFGNRSLTPVEGIWLWNTGMLVAIEAQPGGDITLWLVDSPDPTAQTPLYIGKGRFGGEKDTYILELVTDGKLRDRRNRHTKAKFVAKISNGHLSLTPYSTGLKFDVWRLIPYLRRGSVKYSDKEPSVANGAVRVWPITRTPEFPVIL